MSRQSMMVLYFCNNIDIYYGLKQRDSCVPGAAGTNLMCIESDVVTIYSDSHTAAFLLYTTKETQYM